MKYKTGDRVKISATHPQWTFGKNATVLYGSTSNAQPDVLSYALDVDGQGHCSWYAESDLTKIEKPPMTQHTITQLPNENFLLKLLSDGQTVQTTEIPKEQAHEIASAIMADDSFVGGIPVGYCAVKCSNGDMWVRKYNEPSDPKVCGECCK